MPFGNTTLNDGNEIPVIAFGTGSALRGKDARKSVERALDAGFVHIDTAAIYLNEDSVGEALSGSSGVYVTTKYGGGAIQPSIRASLSKLGLSHVDLYLIHNPRLVRDDLQGSWAEFEIIKEDGLAKSIGVSNFDINDMQNLLKTAKVAPAVNQINFNPYNYAQHKSLLEYSAKYGIVTEAYGSLAPLTSQPGGAVDKPINAAAKRLGATPAQVIFSWVRSKDVVIVTTSSSEQHLQDYLAVADLPPLTTDEIAAIDAAGARGPPSLPVVVVHKASPFVTVQNTLGLVFVCLFVGMGLRFFRKYRSVQAVRV